MTKTTQLSGAIVLFLLSGCALVPFEEDLQTLQGHVININEHGGAELVYEDPEQTTSYERQRQALDHSWVPTQGDITDCRAETEGSLTKGENINAAIDQIMIALHKHVADGKPPHVVLFLHGGLVDTTSGISESADLLNALKDDQDAHFFPIFINWETSLPKSYVNHLFKVRKGREVSPLRGVTSSPFVFLSDVGRSVSRAPIVTADQVSQFVLGGYRRLQGRAFDVPGSPTNWDHVDLPPKDSERTSPFAWISQLIPGIGRVVTVPIMDVMGQGAYQDMRRRARVLFFLDEDFESKNYQSCGALSRLMNELRTFERRVIKQDQNYKFGLRNGRKDKVANQRIEQTKRRAGEPYSLGNLDMLRTEIENDNVLRISIIAHSLGGLVADDLLDENSDMFFEDVVYFAGANSIRDFSGTAVEYLRDNPATRLHSYSLHPFRELTESHYFNLVPEGSLLTWIDRFLNHPITIEDRTLGDWRNLSKSLTVFRYLEHHERERLRIKVFGIDPHQPQTHGQFNDPPSDDPGKHGYRGEQFWREPLSN